MSKRNGKRQNATENIQGENINGFNYDNVKLDVDPFVPGLVHMLDKDTKDICSAYKDYRFSESDPVSTRKEAIKKGAKRVDPLVISDPNYKNANYTLYASGDIEMKSPDGYYGNASLYLDGGMYFRWDDNNVSFGNFFEETHRYLDSMGVGAEDASPEAYADFKNKIDDYKKLVNEEYASALGTNEKCNALVKKANDQFNSVCDDFKNGLDKVIAKENKYLIDTDYNGYTDANAEKAKMVNIATLKFINESNPESEATKHIVEYDRNMVQYKVEEFSKYYDRRIDIESNILDSEKEAALAAANVAYDNDVIGMFDKVSAEKKGYEDIMRGLENKGGPIATRSKWNAYGEYYETAYALGDIDSYTYKDMCGANINDSDRQPVSFVANNGVDEPIDIHVKKEASVSDTKTFVDNARDISVTREVLSDIENDTPDDGFGDFGD